MGLSACAYCTSCSLLCKSNEKSIKCSDMIMDDIQPVRSLILTTSTGLRYNYAGFIGWLRSGQIVGVFIDEVKISQERWGIFMMCSDYNILEKELAHACWESCLDTSCNHLILEGTSCDRDRFYSYLYYPQGQTTRLAYAVVGLTFKDGTRAQVIAYNFHEYHDIHDHHHTVRFEYCGETNSKLL